MTRLDICDSDLLVPHKKDMCEYFHNLFHGETIFKDFKEKTGRRLLVEYKINGVSNL